MSEGDKGNGDSIVSLPSSKSDTSSTLSVATLMSLEPSKTGYLDKKNNSWLAYFFSFLFARWKRRYCVLVGHYFFKFESMHDEKPKGVPLPLESVNTVVEVVNDEALLLLRTIRKTYVLRGLDREDCLSWSRAIQIRKAQAIKERMGHSAVNEKVRVVNASCERIFKDKIKQEGFQGSTPAIINPMFQMS